MQRAGFPEDMRPPLAVTARVQGRTPSANHKPAAAPFPNVRQNYIKFASNLPQVRVRQRVPR
jgi:hypothetical protein